MRVVHEGDTHELQPMNRNWTARQVASGIHIGAYEVYDEEGDALFLIPVALVPKLGRGPDVGRLEMLIDFIIAQRELSFMSGQLDGKFEMKLEMRRLLGLDDLLKKED